MKGVLFLNDKPNDYQLVHEIANLAKEKEIKARDPLEEETFMKTINKIKEKRNFIKEAHDIVLEKYKK